MGPGTVSGLQMRCAVCRRLADTVKGATLVVEAVVEQPDVKRTLYAQLDTLMEPDAILASNTSNLDIFPAGAAGFAGTHDHRALVHAALSVRPRRSLSRSGDEAGRGRDRARHGRRDGQGAGGVQADGARLRRQPAAGGDAIGGLPPAGRRPGHAEGHRRFGAARAGAAHPDPWHHGEGRLHRVCC